MPDAQTYSGFATVAFCEIEPFPRKVLAKHWPEVPQYDDVRTLTAERLAADGIAVDVITGGFPCQDISFAGLGAGLAGERSGLFYEVARLVGELGPRYVILENVGALLSRGLDAVLGTLASLGYDAEWHCIPAAHLGAPHRRDRVWIVAYAKSGTIGHVCKDHWAPSGKIHPFGDTGCACGGYDKLKHREALANPSLLQRNGSEIHGEYSEGEVSELGTGSGSVNVANTNSAGLEGRAQSGNAGEVGPWVQQFIERCPDRNWAGWRTEPNVGGGPDGFPAFLDRYVGRGLSYEESQREIQTLRHLWTTHVSQTLRRTIGGLDRLQQAEVLFAFVREYEAGTDEARILVAGEEASETFLRSLRRRGEVASAPHRPISGKQRSGEHPDAVQVLPRLLALDGAPHWAGSGWEDATPRVTNGVPDRAHRLKSLGNAIVPQIPELIGNAILASLAREAA